MEELQELIKFLKDKGFTNTKIDVDLLCGIIEYFASKQETKQCNIADVSISLARAEKYAKMQHFLGETGRDFVGFNDWRQD